MILNFIITFLRTDQLYIKMSGFDDLSEIYRDRAMAENIAKKLAKELSNNQQSNTPIPNTIKYVCEYCKKEYPNFNSNCTTCGGHIKQIIIENKIKYKPIIDDYKTLALNDIELSSLDEILSIFSNSELNEIKTLELKDNNLTSLKGLSKFKNVNSLFLSGNKITELDEINVGNFRCIDLSNNNFTTITDLTAQNLNKISGSGILFIKFSGNPINNYDSFRKLNLEKISNGEDYNGKPGKSNISIDIDNPVLRELGFKNKNNQHDGGISLTLKPTNNKAGNCFIATATMGSYNNPLVIELRQFRDSWILKKKWGIAFVESYYYYGSKASKPIENSFILRKVSYYFIVLPLVFIARKIKKNT